MTGALSNRCRVILGTMTFGEHGIGARVKKLDDMRNILQTFKDQGYDELDTARMYCSGNTEEVLGSIGVQKAPWDFKLATKVYPKEKGDHEPAKLRKTFESSLQALKQEKVDIFYLHAPDATTPFEVTLAEVDKLHKEGKFTELGISNFTSWQVAEVVHICRKNNWVQPTVYQGMYNLLTRQIEVELLPALEKFGIRFYAYNPLCGGMASGQYKLEESRTDGSRFDPTVSQGQMYRERYWKKLYFEAIEQVQKACQNYNLKPTDVALRWLTHHSKINPKSSGQDAVIIGVSSLEHTKDNLASASGEPLPQPLLEQIDASWLHCMPACPNYFR